MRQSRIYTPQPLSWVFSAFNRSSVVALKFAWIKKAGQASSALAGRGWGSVSSETTLVIVGGLLHSACEMAQFRYQRLLRIDADFAEQCIGQPCRLFFNQRMTGHFLEFG